MHLKVYVDDDIIICKLYIYSDVIHMKICQSNIT